MRLSESTENVYFNVLMLYLLTGLFISCTYILSRDFILNYITANVQAVLYNVVTVYTIDTRIEILTKLVT